jgi:hypothetical protein
MMKRTFVAKIGVVALAMMSGATARDISTRGDPTKPQDFDITAATASTDGRIATFIIEVTGAAGTTKPAATGKVPGAKVDAYVWPTKLDPGLVGFAPASGILAVAITSHPDFDDTPLYDENKDGDPKNDGAVWHAHWVVLGEDKTCPGGLKVKDIVPGKEPLPSTAPGLPLAIDSPAPSPVLDGKKVKISLPVIGAGDIAFDAVTAELQVHPEGKTPFLCVTGVHKIASGDLTLPGRIEFVK